MVRQTLKDIYLLNLPFLIITQLIISIKIQLNFVNLSPPFTSSLLKDFWKCYFWKSALLDANYMREFAGFTMTFLHLNILGL